MNSIRRSLLVAGLSIFASACGRKGPLIYPDMLVPTAPAAVIAEQSGAAVKLQFTIPDKDRGGRSVQNLSGVKISRRTIEGSQKDVCRSCMTDFQLFRTLYLDHLPPDTQRFGNRLILIDNDVRAGNIYSYRIIPFTADLTDGATSAVADARVGVSFPAPAVNIESFPTEVKLQFSSQALLSAKLIGYNLYRSSSTRYRSYQPLNREPLQGNEYIDTTLERGVKYRYSARTVLLFEGGIAESAESGEVEGMLKDDE